MAADLLVHLCLRFQPRFKFQGENCAQEPVERVGLALVLQKGDESFLVGNLKLHAVDRLALRYKGEVPSGMSVDNVVVAGDNEWIPERRLSALRERRHLSN